MRQSVLLPLFLLPLTAWCATEPRFPEEALRGQNAQYQQGFRDGFREAVRLMAGGGGAYPGKSGIRIESAVYGSSRRSCNFTRQLGEQANGKREFEFRAGNQWCGDPDRGADKLAKVYYSCGRDRRQVELREEKSATLRCD